MDQLHLNRRRQMVTIPGEGCKMSLARGKTRSAHQGSGVVDVQATLSRPVSDVDPFSHEFLIDPYPHHEALREAGPVVWLAHYGIWAMARHEQVRDALTDWKTYCSSAGVGLNNTLRGFDSLPLRIVPI
jgi:cytochrome P450